MSAEAHPLNLNNDPGAAVLEVTWSDGGMQRFSHELLRTRCLCAYCRKTPPVPPASVRLTDMRPVGLYGVQLFFDDGHERGIFPWAYLHELGARNAG